MLYLSYVIKSSQSSIFTACGLVLHAVNVTRLKFFIVVLLPSFVTVGFSATLPKPVSSIYDVKSTLTQTVLDAFCEKYHVPDIVHPKLPCPNQSIRNKARWKIGVYTRFFDFANFWIPHSQFLVDVLDYFHINLSWLFVIAAAKVSHFEILCRVHGYVPTVGLFRRDPPPTAVEFSAEACDFFATHQAPFWKFPKPFLCLVALSRYYEFDDNVYPTFWTDAEEEMDPFAFIHHADPTKVRIGERKIKEGQVSLLESIDGRAIPLADRNKQGGQNDNVEVARPYDLNEEGGGAEVGDQTKESDCVVQDEEVNIVTDEDAQAVVVNKPKRIRKKRKVTNGASGSLLPPKKLRDDHDTSGDAEREGDGHANYVSGPNLQTQHPAMRFVISLDSSHHSSTNAADDEVTSIVRSSISPPPVMNAAVAATAVASTSSAPVLGAGIQLVIQSLFVDSTSLSTAEPGPASPSSPRGIELSADTFYISQEMDSETLQQIYVPKWNVINDSAHDDPEEAEAEEAIRLRSQVFIVEAAEAAQINKLNNLKEKNLALEGVKSTLEGWVATLESAAASKDTELASVNTQVAKLNHDLSSLQLSYDELSNKAASLESQKDSLTDQYLRSTTTTATTTALSVSVTVADVSFIIPISMADYEVLNAKASHSPKIIFEQETLETSLEHPHDLLSLLSL
nr:transposase (putative), gypsy type [Tanacetum cinerariifolium]GEY67634.1 transposase (putative), gypsy type [Tanacetum cinerariifolium]